MLKKLAKNLLLALGTFVAVNFAFETIKLVAEKHGEADARADVETSATNS